MDNNSVIPPYSNENDLSKSNSIQGVDIEKMPIPPEVIDLEKLEHEKSNELNEQGTQESRH